MPKNNTIRNVAVVLLLIALLIGLFQLFMLRFQAGDIYPAYSSLRSDPLGTRAFYDSLDNFSRITLRRNYQRLHSINVEPNSAFLFLGAEIPVHDSIPRQTGKILDHLTHSGGRLVISYLPVSKKTDTSTCSETKCDDDNQTAGPAQNEIRDPIQAPEKQPAKAPPPDSADGPDSDFKKRPSERTLISIKEHWGVGFAYQQILPAKSKEQKYLNFQARSLKPDLPAAISWHTNLYFEPIDNRWRTVYSVNNNPVIIERPIGKGSVVLCADSFFLSNEALRSERHPQLMIWLLGGRSNIIFDESHFGIYKQPGVAGLLRQYRFHWFFGALMVVALLFVWKNTVYFVPPCKHTITGGAEVMSGHHDIQGLMALLRRNLSGQHILQACGQEWQQTFKNDRRLTSGVRERIKSILQGESQSSKLKSDPVADYRQISSLINQQGFYSRGNQTR